MSFTLATIVSITMLQGTYHYGNTSCQVIHMHPLEAQIEQSHFNLKLDM